MKMIELVLTIVLSNTPLALVGNDSGVWFIGDVDPGVASFARAQDLDHELCEQVGNGEYLVIHPFTRRPAGLAVEEQAMWFIDDSYGVGLYTIQLAASQRASTSQHVLMQAPVMRSVFETDKHPTDFLLYQSAPLLVFGDGESETELVHFVHRQWESLPSVTDSGACVISFQGELLCAVQEEDGKIMVSSLRDTAWVVRDSELTIDGELTDFFSKDDWPILVAVKEGRATLHGIQNNSLVELASFAIPKGRWGVTSSPSGLTVAGVERNGTTTFLDIGWPSGSMSDPVVLAERFREDDTLLMTVLFISMVCVSIILLSKIRTHRISQ